MKFDWLKEIVGENYTEEMDAKAASAIGTRFVAKADFEKTNNAKKAAEEQLKERDNQIEQLQKDLEGGADYKAQLEALQKQIAEEKAEAERKAKEAAAEADFRARFDGLIGENKWRDELTGKAVYAEFKQALADEANKGKGDKEIFEALTKDQNYYENPNKPADMPGFGDVSGAQLTDNQAREIMGIPLK